MANSEKHNYKNVLDLCAGCGVVGIDFIHHLQSGNLKTPESIDFLEVQNIYNSHFARNISQISGLSSFNFLTMNYNKVFSHDDLKNKYDLIICNPPYFRIDRGILSTSDFKNRCRFFIDSDFDQLIKSIRYLLKSDGVAYVLIKDLQQNGISMDAEIRKFSDFLNFTRCGMIRQTDFYRISHRPNSG